MTARIDLREAYGLRFNPFAPDVPTEALWRSPELETFLWRLGRMVREGGFALLTGDPGCGKSTALRQVAHELGQSPDVLVGVLTRPQSSLPDFYRELGHLFGVSLAPHNRWAGFKSLRETWSNQIKANRCRPLLLIDEAQQVLPQVLTELRILSSSDFDAHSLLTVVLVGDARLTKHFQRDDMLPIASRIRVRLNLGYQQPAQLLAWIEHAMDNAGRPDLFTQEVRQILAEHAAGNLRTLTHMGNDLLEAAVRSRLEQIDAKLYFETFDPRATRSAQ